MMKCKFDDFLVECFYPLLWIYVDVFVDVDAFLVISLLTLWKRPMFVAH